jgi:hypothetical protein
MRKIGLGQIFTILANVGVLAGIVFVAFEIRQSNRIAIGTTAYELNRHFMDINELYITNPDLLDLVIELSDVNFAPNDERQREKAEAYARRILNNWISIEDGRDNGIVSEALYSMAAEDVKAVIRKRPGIVSIYETVSSQYDLTGYELLEPLIAAVQERRVSREESDSTN